MNGYLFTQKLTVLNALLTQSSVQNSARNSTQNSGLKPFLIAAGVIIAALLILLIISKLLKAPKYYKKNKLLTDCELAYYEALLNVLNGQYLLLPQINLATVITKKGEGGRTELFRNADFGIFTKSFEPLALIEINDASHERKDRIERDKKVNKICKKAGLPLITFKTADGIDEARFYREIRKYIRL